MMERVPPILPRSFRRGLLFVPLLLALAGSAQALVLDWPIGDVVNGQRVSGHNIRIQQNYANRGGSTWFNNRPHAGVDLQYTNRVNAGSPVFAAADGTVRYAAYVGYPGSVVVIQHSLPGGGSVYTQYGHLDNLTVSAGQSITQGTKIGVMYNDGSNSHVHFEVRTFLYDPINGSAAGPGYGSGHLEPWQQGWLDPVEYHYEHHGAMPSTAELKYDRNVRSTPNINGGYLTTLSDGQVIVEDIVEDNAGNGNWWYRVRYDDNGSTGYVNAVWKNNWGSDVFFGDAAKRGGLYFPGVLNGSGWDTNFYIRNTRGGSNTVYFKVYHANGSLAYSTQRNLSNNGSWRLSFSTAVTGGTAVITADHTTDLVAVARFEAANSGGDKAFSSHEGIDLPLAYQFVPVVHRDNYDWYNRIFFHNPDSHNTVNVALSFSGASACNRTLSIGPKRTRTLDTYGESCASRGWYGRVAATATFAGSSERAPVAIMSLQENRSGSIRESLASAAISQPLARRLYVPLIQNNNYGYLAGIGADKGAGSGGLSIRYYEANGATCLTDPTYYSWPVIQNPLPASANSCGSVLAARAEGTGSADKIYAQINQLSGNDSTSHPAVPVPAKKNHLPFLEGGTGILRGIQVQNTTGFGTTVTVRFYDHNGAYQGQQSQWLGAYGSWTLVGDHAGGLIPAGARNAEVTASRNLAVMVNNVMPGGSRDKVMDHSASGRP